MTSQCPSPLFAAKSEAPVRVKTEAESKKRKCNATDAFQYPKEYETMMREIFVRRDDGKIPLTDGDFFLEGDCATVQGAIRLYCTRNEIDRPNFNKTEYKAPGIAKLVNQSLPHSKCLVCKARLSQLELSRNPDMEFNPTTKQFRTIQGIAFVPEPLDCLNPIFFPANESEDSIENFYSGLGNCSNASANSYLAQLEAEKPVDYIPPEDKLAALKLENARLKAENEQLRANGTAKAGECFEPGRASILQSETSSNTGQSSEPVSGNSSEPCSKIVISELVNYCRTAHFMSNACTAGVNKRELESNSDDVFFCLMGQPTAFRSFFDSEFGRVEDRTETEIKEFLQLLDTRVRGMQGILGAKDAFRKLFSELCSLDAMEMPDCHISSQEDSCHV